MNFICRKLRRAGAAATVLVASLAFAQVDLATTAPIKVYASVGGAVSFTVSYTQPSPATSDSDLLIGYTANTTATPTFTTSIPAGCIDAATPGPAYDGAQPNTKYINFTAGLGSFPSAAVCGGQTTVTMGTFSGIVASFPAGGKYTISVWNNNSAGATDAAANDVTVCQKRTVSSVIAPGAFVEGGNGNFLINLDAAVAAGCGGFTVPYTFSGPAVTGKGVTPVSGTCSFADAATSCTVNAASQQNALIDGDMALTLTVTNSGTADSYVSTGSKAGTTTVLDDEVGASVVATTQASETGPTNGVVTFARTGSTAAALNLVSAISGTATYTADYSITAGSCAIVSQSASTITVTVPAAAANCTINIVPVDDVLVEGNETVIFGIPTGTGVAGTGSAAVITIADNDTPPVFSLAKAGACAEAVAPTNCTLTIARDSGTPAATTVNFTVTGTATRGTDYTLKTGGCAAGTVLAANSISHPDASPLVIDVCPIDDLIVETGGETVIMTLTANAPTYTLGAVATQTQTIADDDSPQVVTVAVAPATASENGGVLTYTFTRSGGSAAAQAGALTATITPPAVSGRYATTCAATVTFAAASSTATCTVTGVDNAVVDGNVSVVTTVVANAAANPPYSVGSPAAATGTLLDDEVGVSVTSLSATEGSPVSFTITCTGTLTGPVLIPYTITGVNAPDGPAPVGPASIASCPGSVTIAVPTADDATIGNPRTITMALGTLPRGAAASGPQTVTASVLDNDVPLTIPTMGVVGLGLMSLMLAGLVGFQRRRLGK